MKEKPIFRFFEEMKSGNFGHFKSQSLKLFTYQTVINLTGTKEKWIHALKGYNTKLYS